MIVEFFLILAVCIMGVGYSSYKIGIKEGAEKTLDKLQQINVINIDQEGRISPKKL